MLTNIEVGIPILHFGVALITKVTIVTRAQVGAGSVIQRGSRIRLDPVRIDPVVSEAELIQQFRRKRVHFTDGNAAVCVVLIAVLEGAAVKQVREGTRSNGGLVFITETDEEVVLV